MAQAYPIGSSTKGTLYSDGSVRTTGLSPSSSHTNPLSANYQPGRPLTPDEMLQRQNAGALPASSSTNFNAANFQSASSAPASSNGS